MDSWSLWDQLVNIPFVPWILWKTCPLDIPHLFKADQILPTVAWTFSPTLDGDFFPETTTYSPLKLTASLPLKIGRRPKCAAIRIFREGLFKKEKAQQKQQISLSCKIQVGVPFLKKCGQKTIKLDHSWVIFAKNMIRGAPPCTMFFQNFTLHWHPRTFDTSKWYSHNSNWLNTPTLLGPFARTI